MKLTQILEQRVDVFKDADTISVDPDRSGSHDLVWDVMPTVVRIAYAQLVNDRDKHEKTHGTRDDHERHQKDLPEDEREDYYAFGFSEADLKDKVKEVLDDMADLMRDMNDANLTHFVQVVSKDFPHKLEAKK